MAATTVTEQGILFSIWDGEDDDDPRVVGFTGQVRYLTPDQADDLARRLARKADYARIKAKRLANKLAT